MKFLRLARWCKSLVAAELISASVFFGANTTINNFQFVLLGDRTGEAQTGVFEQAWRETALDKPEFVLNAGDVIQGLNDNAIQQEWKQVQQVWLPYKALPFYLVPGNHDVWSTESAAAFRQYSHHALHYSFDVHQAHVTVLNNSRSDNISAEELQFLKQDLQAHQQQPVKIIISHRPSWLFPVLFGNTNFPLHQLAKQYGVKYVVAGHVHQMIHFELEGVTYVSLPSAGGHLRGSEQYEDGWFFAHTLVKADGEQLSFQMKELRKPYGKERISVLSDWGATGLRKRTH